MKGDFLGLQQSGIGMKRRDASQLTNCQLIGTLRPPFVNSAGYPAFPKVCCYLVGLMNIYEVTSL
jgi:hypothetical protein